MKRSTWILVVIFLALVGVFWYLNRGDQTAAEDVTTTPVATSEYIVTAQDGTPIDITIADANGTTVEVARNDASQWVLKQPIETEADQASVGAAITQLQALKVLSSFELDPTTVGLVPPSYVITVKFAEGGDRVLDVGSVTTTNSGYYVRKSGSDKTYVVSKSSLDSLLSMVTTPPYASTPMPSPIPSTEMPTSTP